MNKNNTADADILEKDLKMQFPVRCDDYSGDMIWTADDQRFCDMRGWGYLTGVGGLHLSSEEAYAWIMEGRE